MPKTLHLYEYAELSQRAKLEVERQSIVFGVFQVVQPGGDQNTIPERFIQHREQYKSGLFSENGQTRWPTNLEPEETAEEALARAKADVLSGKVTPMSDHPFAGFQQDKPNGAS